MVERKNSGNGKRRATASKLKRISLEQTGGSGSTSGPKFSNRESGWLNFNRRVLSEAEDQSTPLLERLKFLAICSSNLDEFFMKRVGGFKRQIEFGIVGRTSDGKTPAEQLTDIRQRVLPMLRDQSAVFQALVPQLAQSGIHLLAWKDLSPGEQEWAKAYFLKNVFPVLTPLSVDPGHPFPFISNLSLSLGVQLKHPVNDEKFFARIKIPTVLPQWIEVTSLGSGRFLSLVDLIKANLADLFLQMKVESVMVFRVTRNADISGDEEDAEDLMEMIEEELKLRRFAEVVRLEHGPHADPWMISILSDQLGVSQLDIYEMSTEYSFTSLNSIADLKIPKLRNEPWIPVVPPAFFEQEALDIFQAIRHRDHLIHHPFESFGATVDRLISAAADDPKVLAIKMTLYRTGDQSPIVKSLIRAAEIGKQVVCLVELKARFDEERNLFWAQEMEKAGVHVVYGIVGLKTHAKTCLIIRQEPEGLRCYAHIGTGNYNVGTSRFYTDMGLITAREEITSELVEFFHYLTGRSLKTSYKHLLIAPVNMHHRFKELIERETAHARAGKPAEIVVKMNNMEENSIASLLYEASQAKVSIQMIVRGFCCLKAGEPGLSENLKVLSTIGRFLEHSRIFYFRNGAENPVEGDFFIGSADWMYRNLHTRIECIVPILDRSLREKIWEVLKLYLNDRKQTWDMDPTGNYTRRSGSAEAGVQQNIMDMAKRGGAFSEEEG
jgi:polyphosphate kinase